MDLITAKEAGAMLGLISLAPKGFRNHRTLATRGRGTM